VRLNQIENHSQNGSQSNDEMSNMMSMLAINKYYIYIMKMKVPNSSSRPSPPKPGSIGLPGCENAPASPTIVSKPNFGSKDSPIVLDGPSSGTPSIRSATSVSTPSHPTSASNISRTQQSIREPLAPIQTVPMKSIADVAAPAFTTPSVVPPVITSKAPAAPVVQPQTTQVIAAAPVTATKAPDVTPQHLQKAPSANTQPTQKVSQAPPVASSAPLQPNALPTKPVTETEALVIAPLLPAKQKTTVAPASTPQKAVISKPPVDVERMTANLSRMTLQMQRTVSAPQVREEERRGRGEGREKREREERAREREREAPLSFLMRGVPPLSFLIHLLELRRSLCVFCSASASKDRLSTSEAFSCGLPRTQYSSGMRLLSHILLEII